MRGQVVQQALRALSVDDDGASVTATVDGRQLFRYVYRPSSPVVESPRPYFHPVSTLGGTIVTELRPADHAWHHGLSLALAVVGDENFWGGPSYVRDEGYVSLPNNGSQKHLAFDELSVRDDMLTISERLDWVSQGGSTVLTEQRTMSVQVEPSVQLEPERWTLTVHSALTNVSDDTLSFGSPTTRGRENAGYSGWFLRAAPSFLGGTVASSNGAGGDSSRGQRAEWMSLSNGDATVLMTEEAGNPGSPCQWFVRTEEFAGLGPAPFFSTPLELAAGDTLDLQYMILIADGAIPTNGRSTMTPLRAAIVGTGSVARLHAEALLACPDASIVAAADAMPGRAAEFAEEHGIPTSYDSLEELLAAESVDVVHICTPPGAHAEQTLAAFAAGAHVVVEKPPALSLAELDTMIAAGEAAGRELAVVFQQRTGTAAAHVRELLSSGVLGRPLLALCNTLWFRGPEYFAVPWRGTWQTEGGGTTLSHGIHQIDLLAHLLGDWSSVNGQLWRLDRDVETEDLSTAILRFEGGAVASVVTSVLSPRETSSIRIDTERATITVDHLYGHGHSNWSITPAPGVSEEDVASWAFPPAEVESGHDDLIAQVYSALIAGAPLPAVAAEPARSFEIVAALYASAESGAPVTRELLRANPARASFESPVVDGRA